MAVARFGIKIMNLSKNNIECKFDEMTTVLSRIVECGGIGSEDMYDDARELLKRYHESSSTTPINTLAPLDYANAIKEINQLREELEFINGKGCNFTG